MREVEIDSRPSDAIAIGLRFDVPIYTFESILSEAGIVASALNEDEEENEDELVRETLRTKGSFNEQIRDMANDVLQKMLDEALAKEEYEKAAKIRDELEKRN